MRINTSIVSKPTQDHGMDHVRNIAMLSVVLYHAVGAYSDLTPHWPMHDGHSLLADIVRMLFDVFMMPTFFYLAGYFTLPSLRTIPPGRFILAKLKRLGIPWLLAIVCFIPLIIYMGKISYYHASGLPLSESFFYIWRAYLAGFGRSAYGVIAGGPMSQMHLWFLSLLLIYFFILGMINAAKFGWLEKLKAMGTPTEISPAQLLRTLALFTLATAFGYFLLIHFLVDSHWVVVQLLIQAQPTRLIFYLGYFGLGIFMSTRAWSNPMDTKIKVSAWALTTLALTVIFQWLFQEWNNHIYDSNEMSPWFHISFASIKSLLCMSIILGLLALAKHWHHRSNWLTKSLSAQSYYIYILHLGFVFFCQGMFKAQSDALPVFKIIYVLLTATVVSYLISAVINKFPKTFCAVFIIFFGYLCTLGP